MIIYIWFYNKNGNVILYKVENKKDLETLKV